MVSGHELVSFAEQNGLKIIPYRDPDDWAERINNTNPKEHPNGPGFCLCVAERKCPCPEAVEEIKDQTDPQFACCTCRFYCDQRYIDYWSKDWKGAGVKVGGKQEKTAKKVEKKEAPQVSEMKNPELKRAAEVLQEAAKKIKSINIDEKEKAAEQILRVANEIGEEIETHTCGTCQTFLHGVARKTAFLADECAQDPISCGEERKYTLARIGELVEVFAKADEALQEDAESTPAGTVKQEEPKPGYKDGRHECMSVIMGDASLSGFEQKVKFWIANKICKNTPEYNNIQDAMEGCKKEHPDWFGGQA